MKKHPPQCFLPQHRFPIFQCRKDTVHNMCSSILFIELSIVQVWHYFSFAQVIDKSFSGSTSAAMSRRNRPEYLLQSRYSVTNTNGSFWNRNRRTLQAQKPFFAHSEIFLPVLTCSFGFLVSERNGVHNWICKSVIWLLAATVVPSEDLNEKNHQWLFAALKHYNALL